MLLDIPDLEVSSGLADIVEIGLLAADGLAVGPAGEPITRALDEVARRHRDTHGDASFADIPEVAAVRRLFSALGIDPTRTRPSSEALLRRVLKDKGISTVNNIVDIINLCSLRWLLPMGLYDRAAIQGSIRLEIGGPGAAYPGLGKAWVNLESRPALHDNLGPFGAPTSDSFRTRVREGTSSVLLAVFAPRGAGSEPDRLAHCLADTRSQLIALGPADPERVVVRAP